MRIWAALLMLVSCSSPSRGPSRPGPLASAAAPVVPPVTATAIPSSTPPVDLPKRAPITDVERANEFAARLFKHVASNTKDANTTVSPTIVRLAMSLVHQGAKGETKSELEKAFYLHATDSASDAGRELKHWQQRDAHIAIRLFADKSVAVQKGFQDVAKSQFGSALDALDFAGNPEPARARMNKWVASATENRISELFPEGTVSAETRFVIASAVHFKDTWTTPFEPKDTKPKPFFVLGANAKQVPTMHQRGWYGFTEEEDVLLAALPYRRSMMKMVVALPKVKDGLAALISRLDFAVLDGWNSALEDGRRELLLDLPKFEFTAGGNIKPALQALGANVSFTKDADFSGIGDAEFAVTDVFHKTFIRVDEKGTEAAAASEWMVGAGAPPPPTPFVVDRPFVYYLVDTFKGRVLFIGAVVDPSSNP